MSFRIYCVKYFLQKVSLNPRQEDELNDFLNQFRTTFCDESGFLFRSTSCHLGFICIIRFMLT